MDDILCRMQDTVIDTEKAWLIDLINRRDGSQASWSLLNLSGEVINDWAIAFKGKRARVVWPIGPQEK